MREPLKELVGRRIAECRKRVKMPMSTLANRIEVAPEVMAAMEDGSNWPAPQSLERMALALGVPVAAFFTDEAVTVEPAPLECVDMLREGVARMLREMTAQRIEIKNLRAGIATPDESTHPSTPRKPLQSLVNGHDPRAESMIDELVRKLKDSD